MRKWLLARSLSDALANTKRAAGLNRNVAQLLSSFLIQISYTFQRNLLLLDCEPRTVTNSSIHNSLASSMRFLHLSTALVALFVQRSIQSCGQAWTNTRNPDNSQDLFPGSSCKQLSKTGSAGTIIHLTEASVDTETCDCEFYPYVYTRTTKQNGLLNHISDPIGSVESMRISCRRVMASRRPKLVFRSTRKAYTIHARRRGQSDTVILGSRLPGLYSWSCVHSLSTYKRVGDSVSSYALVPGSCLF